MSRYKMHHVHGAGHDVETDPVCEMKVDPKNPPFSIRYKGRTYYFCSEACKFLFEREPEKYIKMDVSQ